jgi:hypothetical protein
MLLLLWREMRGKVIMLRTILAMLALTTPATFVTAIRGTEVENTPTVVQAIPAKYPPIARAAHISGEVVVEATIDSQGAVTSVNIIRGHKLLIEGAECR